MSVHDQDRTDRAAGVTAARLTVRDIRARKSPNHADRQPLVALTAYTAPMARLLDPHVEILLVGDSLGMVVYGLDTTLGLDLDTMIRHGAAVVRGSKRAQVTVDLPFGSYQESKEVAFRNAARVIKETGASAVKIEGGAYMAETVAYLTERGVPVMGHVGLTPQSVHTMGGFRAQGRSGADAAQIVKDARAIAAAGAFAIVLEGTYDRVAEETVNAVDVPVIGIGASPQCDGQILVTEDLLGLFATFTPKFVKRYAELGDSVSKAVAAYADDVRSRTFPGPEHLFTRKPDRE